MGVQTLKDILWQALNSSVLLAEVGRESIVHRSKTTTELEEINANDDLAIPAMPEDEDEVEELEDFEYDWDEE